MAAFLDVGLRGLAPWDQALAIGDIPFALPVLRPTTASPRGPRRIWRLTLSATGVLLVLSREH